MGLFRFFGSVFGLRFCVFDIDNAYLVVKKLGSFLSADQRQEARDQRKKNPSLHSRMIGCARTRLAGVNNPKHGGFGHAALGSFGFGMGFLAYFAFIFNHLLA
jgi:hypothetical protein